MSTVATPAVDHANFCVNHSAGRRDDHVCMGDDVTLQYVSVETEDRWPAEMYAALVREPRQTSVVTLSGFTDRRGNDQELVVLPSQARSLAAALLRLADLAEHGR